MGGVKCVLVQTNNFKMAALHTAMIDVDDIAKDIEAMSESRETILTISRRTISACGHAILLVHRGRQAQAGEVLDGITEHMRRMQDAVLPQTASSLILAQQEYVEARAFLELTTTGTIPKMQSLQVQPESYVLGLMDLIGELKRHMLDQVRVGDTPAAYKTFDTMEELYTQLFRFAQYDRILKEARRKLDIARMTLESCRGIITEERRRAAMMQNMRAMGFEPTNSSETSPSS